MKKERFRFSAYFLCFLLCLFVFTSPSRGEEEPPYSFRTEWAKLSTHDGSQLIPPVSSNASVAVLWLLPRSGYHTYAYSAGSDGFPLQVKAMANGEVLNDDTVQIRYLPGEETLSDLGKRSFLYKNATPVFLLFSGRKLSSIHLEVSLLACSDQHCFPVTEHFSLSPAPEPLEDASQKNWFPLLKKSSPANLPEQPGPPVLAKEEARLTDFSHDSFLPSQHTSVFRQKKNTGSALSLPAEEKKEHGYAFAVQSLQGSLHIDGWFKAVVIGLFAGLLLNVMPCVLPVLSIKFSLLLNDGNTLGSRTRSIREHALFFAAGILTWFTLLALLSGLTGLLWGQIFQSQEVVFLMLLIVFCMGLAMFDVFHLPMLDLQPNTSSPRLQAFSTGMFATLLATPCSGPLLGGVLAWGMTKPLPVLVTVFLSTGIGMAVPHLMLALFPRLVRFLPRPGAWLHVIERALGFLLMGTAIYLFSLLPDHLHVKTLITLLVAAAAAWGWGHWGSLRGSTIRRISIALLACCTISLSAFWTFLPAQNKTVPWENFTEASFRDYLGKKNMIVEFTADWCPTCKILENTVLSAPNLLPLLDQHSLVAIKVDMTYKNKAQEELLKDLGGASIPLLAIFPAGENANAPVVLRDIYTSNDLHLALRQAKIPHTRMDAMLKPVKQLSKP